MTIAFYGTMPNSSPNACSDLANAKIRKNPFEPMLKCPKDSFETSQKKCEPPYVKVKMRNILFNRYNKDQINMINSTGELPPNIKITDDNKIVWNLFDFTKGTHTLPLGYELKNDLLGFTHVVRKDTRAWYLKDTRPAIKY